MIIPRSNAARRDFSVGYTRLKNCVPNFFILVSIDVVILDTGYLIAKWVK